MSTVTAPIAGALAALLFLCNLTACEASTTPSSGYTCRSTPEAPHVSKGEKAKGRLVTIAKVRTTCTKLVDSHRVTMLLERKVDGRWVRMASDADTRVPQPGKELTTDVDWSGCITVRWRLTLGGSPTLGARTGKIPPLTRERTIPRDACDLDSPAT